MTDTAKKALTMITKLYNEELKRADLDFAPKSKSEEEMLEQVLVSYLVENYGEKL